MDRNKEIETASRIEREKVFSEVRVAYECHKDINHYCITSACIEKYAVPLFKAGVEWADEHPNNSWISVEDRLPEYGTSIPLNEKQRFIVRVVSGSIEPKVTHTIAWLSSRYKFNVEMDWVKVTHWMPIPELNVEPKDK